MIGVPGLPGPFLDGDLPVQRAAACVNADWRFPHC